MTEIKNAIITSVDLDTERGLTMWVHLDYGGSGQGFGGYMLYSRDSWEKDTENNKNYTGHFISRVMEVVGVDSFQKLKGKAVRVKAGHGSVDAIGNYLEDKWFIPKDEISK